MAKSKLKLSFEEVKDLFEQLQYTDIQDKGEGFYTALNPYGELREFGQFPHHENPDNVIIIAKRDLREDMKGGQGLPTV